MNTSFGFDRVKLCATENNWMKNHVPCTWFIFVWLKSLSENVKSLSKSLKSLSKILKSFSESLKKSLWNDSVWSLLLFQSKSTSVFGPKNQKAHLSLVQRTKKHICLWAKEPNNICQKKLKINKLHLEFNIYIYIYTYICMFFTSNIYIYVCISQKHTSIIYINIHI